MTDTERLASEMTDDEILAHLEARKASRKAKLEAERPKVAEVLLTEGGSWIIWGPETGRIGPDALKNGHYTTVHAIKFEDGSVWDVANGWRG